MPLWSAGIYLPSVYFIRHLQTFILYKYLIEGKERESGNYLKIAFFGKDPKIMNYWAEFLFREKPIISQISKNAVWNIFKKTNLNSVKADLIIVEITKLTRPFVNSGGFILPRWFNTLIDVGDSLAAIERSNDHKRINKFGFTCQERFSVEDLKFFYERMFIPYISTRHTESSVIVDFSYFLKRLRKKDSRLFFLLKDNEPVAASFNERKNGMIKFSGLGVLDAKREILTMGAIRALYYFMLLQYKKENVQTINFGGTSPLLSDGLTRFKSSLHAFPNRNNFFGEKSLWVFPVYKPNSIHAVLTSNPFVYISGKEINRAVFLDPAELKDKNDFMHIIKNIRYEKTDSTKIFCLNSTNEITQWIKEESLTNHSAVKVVTGV